MVDLYLMKLDHEETSKKSSALDSLFLRSVKPIPDLSVYKNKDVLRQKYSSLLLLLYIARKKTGKQKITLGYNENGKPFMKGHGAFHFNISHTVDTVIIGTSDKNIGVDIENSGRRVDCAGIARRFFSKAENEFLISFINKKTEKRDKNIFLEKFLQIWTLKESYIKYLGTGVSGNLNNFTIYPTDNGVFFENTSDEKTPFFKNYMLGEKIISVCSDSFSFPEKIETISFKYAADYCLTKNICSGENR